MHFTVFVCLTNIECMFYYFTLRQAALNPVNFLGGIQLYYSLRMARTNTRGDFENYIVRLGLLPQQVKQHIIV